MSRLTKLPWIANWNDASGVKNPPPVGEGVNASLGFIAERFLRDVAKTASWHTFPSDRMRTHICTYLKNGTEQRSTTIPHIAFKHETVKQDRKDNVFTLCYAGNLYAGRNPDIFLQGLREFIDSQGITENCKLVFIGLEDIGLTQLIKKYGLEDNTHILGPLNYTETLQQFSNSDVLVVLEAAYTDGIYLPAKFVDYVQAGRPILAVAPSNGNLKDIIDAHGGGIAADCTSVSKIKSALSELYSSWKEGGLDQKYGSDRLYKLFAPKTIIELYKGIFDKICTEKRH
jgi:glycosyltransferase involved in cell wall biosynthesis